MELISDFVGREGELEKLQKTFDISVRKSKGRLYLIEGEAGIGKTRLVEQFASSNEDCPFLWGVCLEDSEPYHPFLEMVRRHVKAISLLRKKDTKADDIVKLFEQIEAKLETSVADKSKKSTKAAKEAKGGGREELFNLFTSIFLELSDERPLIMLVDNLHTADQSSFALFQHLIENCKSTPIALFGAYRSDSLTPPKGKETHPIDDMIDSFSPKDFTLVSLEPFEALEVLDIVESLMQVQDLPTLFIKRLYKETGGNPLFVREIIAMIMHDQSMDKSDKSWYTKIDLSSISLPKNVTDIISNRIDNLSENAYLVLQYCALISGEFDIKVLQKSTGLKKAEMKVLRAELEENKLIKEVDDGVYRFEYPEIQKIILKGIEDKRSLHIKLANTFETVYKGELDPVLYNLARHYTLGMVFDKAFRYAEMAGDKAIGSYAPDDALLYYKSALSSVMNLDETDEQRRSRMILWSKIGDIYLETSEWVKANKAFKRTLLLSKRTRDHGWEAEAYNRLGDICRLKSEWEDASTNYEMALAIAEGDDDKHRLADSYRGLGYINWRSGNFTLATKHYEKCLHLAEEIKDIPIMGMILIEFGNVYNEKGELEKAIKYYRKSLDILSKVHNLPDLSRAYNNLGDTYLQMGEWKSAVDHFNKSGAVAKKVGNKNMVGWALFNAAEALAKGGEPDKALTYCAGAKEILVQLGDTIGMAALYKDYGIAYRFKKDWPLAEKSFKESVKLAEKVNSPYTTSEILFEFGLLYQDMNEDVKAKKILAKAHNIAESIGAHGLIERIDANM